MCSRRFILGAAIGFGIGVAAGAITGPGAIVTGAAAMAAGAVAGVAAAGAVTGFGALGVSGYLLFRPKGVIKDVVEVRQAASLFIQPKA